MIFELVSNRDLFVSGITGPQKENGGGGGRGYEAPELDARAKTRVIRLQVIEGLNTSGQIAFCTFQSFLV